MPRDSKKYFKINVVQSDSEICRPSPYIINLKKVEAKKEEAPLLQKRKVFLPSFQELSFVGPFYLLFTFIFGFFKKFIKSFKGFFAFLGKRIPLFFCSVFRGVKSILTNSLNFSKNIFKIGRFSLPVGWQKGLLSFLVFSFVLVLPFQAFSYYSRFENFLVQNKLDKFNFRLIDVLKILPQKEGVKKAFLVSDIVKKILGYETEKRYLIIFQNNNEIRPTGGFIGSFALVDIWRGEIKKIEVPPQGSYALQGWLLENVLAPEPLQLIASRWEFQDANWFPDFPASAQKIMWFYTKSGGPSVDGVIAVTADFFRKILEVIGPIGMPNYGKVIDSENFDFEIQKSVEIEYDRKENKPKQIIADLVSKTIEKILINDSGQLAKLAGVLNQVLIEKDLLLYFNDKEIQKAVLDLGWGGEIKETSGDYLMVVDTNIAGGKTDAVIENKIEHLAQISDDGSIINRVTITKIHRGIKGELFTGVRNVDYLRIYVPKGSELLEAKGFEAPPQEFFDSPEDYLKPDKDLSIFEKQISFDKESGTKISEEFGKTVFGNWVQIDPGETKAVVFTYRLPFKLSFEKTSRDWFSSLKQSLGLGKKEGVIYSLLIQKQPGSRAEIKSELKFPYNWRPIWKYPESLQIKDAAWLTREKMTTDFFYGAMFEEKL